MAAESRELLRRVSLFASLNDEALAGLIGHLRRRGLPPRTKIFPQDQAGDALYIVESGRVRLFVPAEGGEELTVDIAGPGEVFGESWRCSTDGRVPPAPRRWTTRSPTPSTGRHSDR